MWNKSPIVGTSIPTPEIDRLRSRSRLMSHWPVFVWEKTFTQKTHISWGKKNICFPEKTFPYTNPLSKSIVTNIGVPNSHWFFWWIKGIELTPFLQQVNDGADGLPVYRYSGPSMSFLPKGHQIGYQLSRTRCLTLTPFQNWYLDNGEITFKKIVKSFYP